MNAKISLTQILGFKNLIKKQKSVCLNKDKKLKKRSECKKIQFRLDSYNIILDKNPRFRVNFLIFNRKKLHNKIKNNYNSQNWIAANYLF